MCTYASFLLELELVLLLLLVTPGHMLVFRRTTHPPERVLLARYSWGYG